MTYDFRGYINLGQPDLREVIRAAYDLSGPQGMGYLHYREGGLSDEEVAKIIERESGMGLAPIVAGMDYVNGRSVKMHIRKNPETGDLYIQGSWYDHGRGSLEALLARFNISPSAIDEADAAREEANQEYRAKRAENAKLAVRWLKERGGAAPNPYLYLGDPVPEDIHEGLHAGCDEGSIRYDNERREYRLVERADG